METPSALSPSAIVTLSLPPGALSVEGFGRVWRFDDELGVWVGDPR